VRIRHGSWDDFDAVYALIEAPDSPPDWLRSRWRIPSFDLQRHLWLAENGSKLEAFGALYAPDSAHVRGDAAHIPPLLERIEAQARADGLEQITFVLPEWDEPAWRAYLACGFGVATEVLEMERDLGEPIEPPAFPGGVAVRTYRDADAPAVQRLLDEAYVAWDRNHVPMVLDDWLQWMTGHANFDADCWWLAEAEGAPAGVCLTWVEGWVKDIATTAEWRGRGLGKALLLHALAEHRRRGNAKVGLKVDSVNPTSAIALYKRVGFRTTKKFVVLLKKL
jgi:ribosomal protein S18 acetylase RimI-like enzyme